MSSNERQQLLGSADTLVIKVGSRVLSDPAGNLDLHLVRELASQLCQLAATGKHVVLVSSGAVASGMGRLGMTRRPTDLPQLQAVASVGQAHLIQAYERYLADHGRHASQILLVADDLENRARYLNVRNTILALLNMGVIPIINENDSVAVDELQATFGDNDRLAAMVAGLFAKPALLILSDVDGVFDRDPHTAGAQILPTITQVDQSVTRLAAQPTSGLGKGGMASKLRAAQFVTRSGAPVVIAGGRTQNVLLRLMDGESLGTIFVPQPRALPPRKRWLGFSAQTVGVLIVDQGAKQALEAQGNSLLAIGVSQVQGQFEKGDVVAIQDAAGSEVARGLTNYSSEELARIRGLRSPEISKVLGHCPYDEVVHCDNLVLTESSSASS